MARRRYQHPTPFMEGRFWWLFIRKDEVVAGKRIRTRKRVKLAPIAERHLKQPPKEVPPDISKRADEVLRPHNQGLITIGSATPFNDYVEEYKVSILPTFTARTQERYEGIIRNYLSPEFGQLPLCEVTALRIQKYISGLAKSPLSHESKDKIRDVLSSILGSAKQYGLIVTNPAEGVRLPPAKKGKRGKPYITPDQFHQLI